MSTNPTNFRLVATYGDKTIDVIVEHSTDPTAAAAPWRTIQRWQLPAVTADQRRPLLAASAREHGWLLPDGRWPRIGKGKRQQFPEIHTFNPRPVIADATKLRDEALAKLADAEAMWRLALHTGSAHNLSGSEMAPYAGVSVQRVNQVLREPAIAERAATTTQLQWSKR